MAAPSARGRTDRATHRIAASPDAIYRAFTDPDVLVQWLPPRRMTGRVDHFDARAGGTYKMTLSYLGEGPPGRGKSGRDRDVVEGRFLDLVPGRRIVQSATFVSDDAALMGDMTVIWDLRPVAGGTEVTITCENVPSGIRPEDHDEGLRSTLANLAGFIEG